MNEIMHAQSETALAQRSGNGLALLAGGRAETAKALAQAVQACASVEKSSTNEFHKYHYASADAIIEVGRKALAGAGLALLPMEASLNGSEREGPDRYELVRTFVLLHSSGEVTPLRVCWPVCPEKGRPLDKATAIADTLSLSYLLRDLLMMARVAPGDDMNQRDDRPPARKPQDDAERNRKLEERVRVNDGELAGAGRCKPGELLAHVLATVGAQAAKRSPVPTPWTGWDRSLRECAVEAVKAFMAAHAAPASPAAPVNGSASPPASAPAAKVSPEQVQTLWAMLDRKGRRWPTVLAAFDWPKMRQPQDLSPAEHADVMQALSEEADAPARK